jgi:hypothetical protein
MPGMLAWPALQQTLLVSKRIVFCRPFRPPKADCPGVNLTRKEDSHQHHPSINTHPPLRDEEDKEGPKQASTCGLRSAFWMSMMGTAIDRVSTVPTQLDASSGVNTMWLRGEMICGRAGGGRWAASLAH